MDYLDALQDDSLRSHTFRRSELCRTIAKNPCDLLTITAPSKDGIPFEERKCKSIAAIQDLS